MGIKGAVELVNTGVLQENQLMALKLSGMDRPQNVLVEVIIILTLILMEVAVNIENGHN